MEKITFNDANDIVVSIKIDEQKYKIRLLWNALAGFWTLSLLTNKGESILSNVNVVPNFPLLMNHHDENVPAGEFVVISQTDEVGRDSFKNGSATLMYASQEEFYGTV